MINFYSLFAGRFDCGARRMALSFKSRYFISKCLFVAIVIAMTVPGKVFAQTPAISYSNPQTLTVGKTIIPMTPANAGGAVGAPGCNLLATHPGFNDPNGLAVDAAGNIYVADTYNNQIVKIPLGGGPQVTVGYGFLKPMGVVVDAAGIIYVADSGNGAIDKVFFVNGKFTTITLASGFNNPVALALDAAGNVYVAEHDTVGGISAVKKIFKATGIIRTVATGFPYIGIAIDPAGNVYAADNGDFFNPAPRITEIPADGSKAFYTYVTVTGVTGMGGIAVDAAGNIYYTQLSDIIDNIGAQIYMIPSGGGQIINLHAPCGGATGIAVDAAGYLVTTEFYNAYEIGYGYDPASYVRKYYMNGGYLLKSVLPAGLRFDNTTGIISGTPLAASAAKNYTIAAYNSSGGSLATLNIKINAILPPIISYNSPQYYAPGVAIPPLVPVNTGGTESFGYSNIPVFLNTSLPSWYLAIDAAGNIYVSAQESNDGVTKIPAGGGAPVSIGSGFSQPKGIAVDAAGNVYVADWGNNVVKKTPPGGAPVVIGTGFLRPTAVAVDAAGNVYVADWGNNAVKKIPSAGGIPISIGSGFNQPQSVAVDAVGNIYVTDSGNGVVKKIAPAGGQVIIGSGFSQPQGIAVDASGNVFVTDKTRVGVTIIPVAGSPGLLSVTQTIPVGVAVDAAGNVYLADFNDGITEIKHLGGYYVSPRLPAGLIINGANGIISGTPGALVPAANYTITGFNLAGSSTTTLQIAVIGPPTVNYSSPQTFTQFTAISPLTPASSGVAAPAYSASSIKVNSSSNSPYGVAIDAADNLYVASAKGNTVKKMPAGGGTVVSLGYGFNNPHGVAVDRAGNVYVADYGNNAIKKIPIGGGAPVTLGSGFSQPTGVAVDAAGNVYVADYGNNEVKKIPVGSNTPLVVSGGTTGPAGIALDADGDLFVSYHFSNKVVETKSGTNSPVNIATGFASPNGLTVDPSGNVFVADEGNNNITELPVGGGAPIVITQPLFTPVGVAVDSKGNLFVADPFSSASVKKIQPIGGYYLSAPLPAGLNLDAKTGAISGTPTVPSPAADFIITGYNAAGEGASATVSITVNTALPAISYPTPQVFKQGVPISSVSPTNTGVTVVALGYSATKQTIIVGVINPYGIAADAAGNVYVADRYSNTIKKLLQGGGMVTVGSGFITPQGVAADATGNVYVSDIGDGTVKKIPVDGSPTVIIASGFSIPSGLTIDAAGNIYVTDSGPVGSVVKIIANGGGMVTLRTGFSNPQGIAVDAIGNVYVADANLGIKEIPANGGNTQTVAGTLTNPFGIAIDASGNIFVANAGNVYRLLPGGGKVTVGTGMNSVYGVAADGTGNVYVTDNGNNIVYKILPTGGYFITPSLPAGLSFSSVTGVFSGTPTAASPATDYTVTAYDKSGGNSTKLNIKVLSNNADLSGITLSSGTLNPAFIPATTSYAATVTNNTASITLTPAAADPGATITINGLAVTSGQASAPIALTVGLNTLTAVVTAADGTTTKTYTVTVSRALSTDASLSNLAISNGTLAPVFAAGTTNYSASVGNGITSMTVTPTATNANATVTVNGTTVTSGTASPVIPLNVGTNNIALTVTAADGLTTMTYMITLTRLPSANANLALLAISAGALSPIFASATTSYTASVSNGKTSTTLTATSSSPAAAITVNGTTVTSGTASSPINLNVGLNVLTVVITAQDGVTQKTYTVNVTRAASANANLAALKISAGTLVRSADGASYSASVTNGVTSVTLTPTVADNTATVMINGTTVASGTASGDIALIVGLTTIPIIVTAQDGVTQKTYMVTISRAAGPVDIPYVAMPTGGPQTANDGITVHQGVSPNGDGVNDVLTIEGISQYPDNKLLIMNRSGTLVYEARGYDNTSKVFDGHSSKNGQLQLPGTYFYSLDYRANGVTKHKTGFIVLKY